MLTDKLIKYLHEILNVNVSLDQWQDGSRLPLFLQDDYVYFRARVYGLELLLMVDPNHEERPPSIVGAHLEQVRSQWGGEVVYVRERISSYIRKRLIEAGIQFIVPGNQLYLPVLAVDLREYFHGRRKRIHRLSPAAQALALYWVYNGSGPGREWTTPTEMAHILDYTKMTMSRAFKEVEGVLNEAFKAEKADAAKRDYLQGRELWERLQPFLRNPVGSRHYFPKTNFDQSIGLRSGLTALAVYSMLAEPIHETYAISRNDWNILKPKDEIPVLEHIESHVVEVEIWSYPPKLFVQYGLRGTVDPLSLYLSMKESSDERVEIALEELLGGVRW